MRCDEQRKYNRYDTFLPVYIRFLNFIESKLVELPCWTKDISADGISLEICISKQAEINFLHDLLNVKRDLDASFSLVDDPVCNEYEIKLKCSARWVSTFKHQNIFVVGLKIEKIAAPTEHIWDDLINKLERVNNAPIFSFNKTSTDRKAVSGF